MGFKLKYLNETRYNNYGFSIAKPTKFGSNIDLNLSNEKIKAKDSLEKLTSCYNERSEIPEALVEHIKNKVIEHLEMQNNN